MFYNYQYTDIDRNGNGNAAHCHNKAFSSSHTYMRTSRLFLGIVLIIILALVAILLWRKNNGSITNQQYAANRMQPAVANQEVQKKLASCNSLPNGTTTKIVQASKVFINIPKEVYPNVNIALSSNGANASWATDTPYGYAMGKDQKAGCWSYYFEFNGEGTVSLMSKSGVTGTPDYILHFEVSKS